MDTAATASALLVNAPLNHVMGRDDTQALARSVKGVSHEKLTIGAHDLLTNLPGSVWMDGLKTLLDTSGLREHGDRGRS